MPDQYTAQDFYRKQPVINHLHWDGSLPVERLFEFYQHKGEFPLLPEKDISGNKINHRNQTERVLDSPEKLAQFQQGLLTHWGITDVFKIPIGAMKTDNDLILAAIAHCEYLLQQGVKYAETRFAPPYHLNPYGRLFHLNDVIEQALLGFKLGEANTEVKVRPIICINREIDKNFIAGKSPVNSIDVVKAAIKYAENGIAGIDLACYEPCAPPDDFVSAYRLTLDTPLKRTIHAGEMMGSDEANLRNIRYALEHLRPDGLGHAISLHKDPKLMEIVAKGSIRIESSPRSNLHCQFIKNPADLGLDQLLQAGVKVTINPDDPMMWPQGDVADNLALAANAYGIGVVNQTIRNSIETAWGLNKEEKEQMVKDLQFNKPELFLK